MTDEWHKAACSGKFQFTTPQEAQKALRNHHRRHKTKMEKYHCTSCEKWHIGNAMPRIKKELRAI